MSFAPIGWANTTTPGSATVSVGSVTQTANFTSAGEDPLNVGFDVESSWSDTANWSTSDPSGVVWVCNTSGVYHVNCTQNLTITPTVPVAPVVSAIIPNTTFFFDLSNNAGEGAVDSLILEPITSEQTYIAVEALEPTPDVLMGSFTTPVGFLTSKTIVGGSWLLQLFGGTTDITEMNTYYMNVYTVDVDGVSNPILIGNGSLSPMIINQPAVFCYQFPLSIATTVVEDLTKRIQVRLYTSFGIASATRFYFRNSTFSNVYTTLSQYITSTPVIRDRITTRITITSPTTEFNQVFGVTIPITLVANETVTYATQVSGTTSIDAGSEMVVTVKSDTGDTTIVSGYSALPTPVSVLGWNLVAQGEYGNVGVV